MSRPATPAFVTGTSSEYLGRRPLRRILRERPLVCILGPRGSGKTSVARRIAADVTSAPIRIDTQQIQQAVVERIGEGRWARRLVDAEALILDGPIFLTLRPGVVGFLRELLDLRRARRTIVCEVSDDGSVGMLMDGLPSGCMVTLGLRFPASRSGRVRFGRRACDALGLPRNAARGTDALEPWGYDVVLEELERRKLGGREAAEVSAQADPAREQGAVDAADVAMLAEAMGR